MLGRQSVIHVKGDQLPVETVHDPFAKVMVKAEAAKHPPTAMEVDIGRPLLRLALVIELRSRLEDADGDVAPFDRALLLCDAEDIRTRSTAIGDGVPRRVLSEVLYRHLVGVQAPSIELVVVFYVDRIETREQLRGNAVVQWLVNLWHAILMQALVVHGPWGSHLDYAVWPDDGCNIVVRGRACIVAADRLFAQSRGVSLVFVLYKLQ